MKTALFALLLLAATSAGAQEIVWEKTFGDSIGIQQGVDVIRTTNGDFVAVAQAGSGTDSLAMIYLVRTSDDGVLQWWELLPGHDSTAVTALYPAADDAFYLIGSTRNGASSGDTSWHAWSAKFNAQGAMIWEKKYGAGRINGAEQTADGGFILAGVRDTGALLMKLDADGVVGWERSYHHGMRTAGASVRQTAEGGYIIVGSTSVASGADADVLLIRTNSSGDSLWGGAYAEKFVSMDEGYCVEEMEGGGFMFIGIERTSDFTDRFGNLFMAGIGTRGEVRWFESRSLYARGTDSLAINVPHMSRRLSNGKIVICGASGPDNTMPFLAQIGNDGTIEWQKMLSDLIFSQSVAPAFRALPDGGFIVAETKMQHLTLARLARPTSGVETAPLAPIGKMNLSLNEQVPISRHAAPSR